MKSNRVHGLVGIWGGKGQGKTFQTELIFRTMGMEPIIMSAGELESERAGIVAILTTKFVKFLCQTSKQ